MRLFVDELRTMQSPWLATFEAHQTHVETLLPALDRRTAETVPHLATARANPNPTPP
jgi:hypothetical protein